MASVAISKGFASDRIPVAAGVYIIAHEPTKTAYIGQSVNMRKRIRQHQRDLTRGAHRNAHFQAAWDKYGPEAFVADRVCTCEAVSDLDVIEGALLRGDATHDGYRRLYNIAIDPSANMRGVKHTDATKEKMRAAKAKAAPVAEETKQALKQAKIKQHLSDPSYRSRLAHFFALFAFGMPKTKAAIRAGLSPNRANYYLETYKEIKRGSI